MIDTTAKKREIERQINGLLGRSAAFQALPSVDREDLERDTARITEAIADEAAHDVDFPSFVKDLVEGTFGAIVDGSIQQMKAYAEMVKEVSASLDASDDKHAAARRSIARGRQQMLATMVRMGINRIVVTDGKINAKALLDEIDGASAPHRKKDDP